MQNENIYQYEESEEETIQNIRLICRICDNIKKGRSLNNRTGLEQLKVCFNCRNDIINIRNDFFFRRLLRLNRIRKIKKEKKNVVIALHRLKIGVKAGIHQNILDFII